MRTDAARTRHGSARSREGSRAPWPSRVDDDVRYAAPARSAEGHPQARVAPDVLEARGVDHRHPGARGRSPPGHVGRVRAELGGLDEWERFEPAAVLLGEDQLPA